MKELDVNQIISKDKIIKMFSNLPELLDFQRRFLLSMEATLSLAPDEQRIGLLFIQQEPSFSVYDSFCGNYKQATNIAIQEHAKLQKLSNLIEPTYELPSYLIKPVQRVCKYPLLINELIKNTDSKKYPFMDELEAGLDAIKRVTQNVNEQKRLEENREIKNDLVDQIEDLKVFLIN